MGDAAPGSEHVIRMLRADHEHIKELLTLLMDARERVEQERVMAELFLNLRLHSVCEQKVFYPSLVRLVDAKLIAEFGKDLYYLLSLMLELESTCAHSAPLGTTLSVLADRFEQHVRKDENIFHHVDEISDSNQLNSVAAKMDQCRGELQQKLERRDPRESGIRYSRPAYSRRSRCA
ncbi:MAG TPA: hemerythrin domain-containing protein [Drouetiella sp.]